MSLKISDNGIALLKSFEGLRLSKYDDAVGYPTIGYGHLIREGDQIPDTIDEAEAERLLRKDLEATEQAVIGLVRVPINQNQFDALVSLTFNIGAGNLASSTLLKKLNAGDTAGAAEQFGRWHRASGRILAGLTKRRAAEAALFTKE